MQSGNGLQDPLPGTGSLIFAVKNKVSKMYRFQACVQTQIAIRVKVFYWLDSTVKLGPNRPRYSPIASVFKNLKDTIPRLSSLIKGSHDVSLGIVQVQIPEILHEEIFLIESRARLLCINKVKTKAKSARHLQLFARKPKMYWIISTGKEVIMQERRMLVDDGGR
ncbi:hypothetical protein BT96DRAFT_1062475 [Gymnopus androsaceus JB14]|uniref:Uncharacterized protein n=1 Tax=Gymnopus androsaceus JB14 TaxID=1447944 RepID=A0A6A4H0T6_9AGAR|nr:hypothetical protein BT96DRAFT_1062475 [Gymnopus androsaceus JB14]